MIKTKAFIAFFFVCVTREDDGTHARTTNSLASQLFCKNWLCITSHRRQIVAKGRATRVGLAAIDTLPDAWEEFLGECGCESKHTLVLP